MKIPCGLNSTVRTRANVLTVGPLRCLNDTSQRVTPARPSPHAASPALLRPRSEWRLEPRQFNKSQIQKDRASLHGHASTYIIHMGPRPRQGMQSGLIALLPKGGRPVPRRPCASADRRPASPRRGAQICDADDRPLGGFLNVTQLQSVSKQTPTSAVLAA